MTDKVRKMLNKANKHLQAFQAYLWVKELSNFQLFCVLGFFYLFKATIFIMQNQYVNGDIGIGLLVVDDFKNLEPQSWFFYGNYYYGVFYYFLVAVLTFPFRIGFAESVFVEGLFFLAASFTLHKFLKKNYLLPTILFNIFLYWGIPLNYYIQYFQGYSFIALTFIGSAYLLYKNYYVSYPFRMAIFFGLMSGLLFWINASFLAIVVTYLLLLTYAFRNQFQKLCLLLSTMGASFAIGLIPFIAGIIFTDGKSLTWFSLSTGTVGFSPLRNFSLGVIDFLSQFLFFFNQQDSFFITKIDAEFILNELQFGYLISAIFGISLVGFAMGSLKEKQIRYSVGSIMLFLFLLSSYRGGTRFFAFNVLSIQRFIYPIFILISMLAYQKIIDIYLENINLNLRMHFLRAVASFTIVVGLSGSALFLIQDVILVASARDKIPIYDSIVADLVKIDAKDVYCYDFYIACSQTAFLAREYDINVEIIESTINLNGRNPVAEKTVEKAIARGEVVYTFSPHREPITEDIIIQDYEFRGQRYVLYEGGIDISGLPYKRVR